MEYRYDGDVLYIKCNKCWKWWTIDEFPPRKELKFWVRNSCRECWREQMNKMHSRWYKNNTDSAKEKMRDYHIVNRDRINSRVKAVVDNHTDNLGFSWYNFHVKTKNYIIKNRLKPKLCAICWNWWKIEAHHPSYESFDKWSYVVFCCHKCHSDIHRWKIECPSPVNLLECKPPLKGAAR